MLHSAHRPLPGGESQRHAAHRAGHGPGFRAIVLMAPVVAFAIGLARALLEPSWTFGYFAASVALPALVVIGLLTPADRRWVRPLAAIALLLEAAAAGAYLPGGLAVAVILPVIAVGLVQARLRDRALVAAFAVAGVAAAVGIGLAVLVGPGRVPFGPTPAVLTIGAFVAIEVFALALVWRSTRDLRDALDHAEHQIAARGMTESELDRTSEILSAIVRSSPVATLAFGLDLGTTLWNPAAERIFGWSAAEVIGRPLPEAMIPEAERSSWAARIERTINGAITNGDRVRRRTKDGQERSIDIYAAPLRDRLGRPIGIAAQLVDVTERVELEAQLVQAQKMETIGLLASGIAHDFNNTLTAAGGFAALIELNATDEEVRSDAKEIVKAVERARLLTGRLLAFGGLSDLAVRSIDAGALVTGLLPLLRQLIGPETEIELELPTQPTIVRIDPGQLEQALINLAINARDAMPGGGRLTVTVGQPGGDQRLLYERRSGPPVEATEIPSGERGFIDIAVRDTGTGIPAALRQRIFEPFFTTKGHGHGSGLGLAMVKGFVAAAHGEVCVESTIGQGTTFVIRLPQAPAVPPLTTSESLAS